jgi:phosphocarrier protein
MPSQVVTVASSVGLHARPASLLVKAAGASGFACTIGRVEDKAVNASSMLMVLALGVKCGEALEITVADGPGAEDVLQTLVDIVGTNHDEDNSHS